MSSSPVVSSTISTFVSETRGLPGPAIVTLRRRERDRRRRLRQQYSVGRPSPDWKLCGNPQCHQSCCIAVRLPKFVLKDREKSGWDALSVDAIFSEFAYEMMECIWSPGRWNTDNVLRKVHSIETFITSPPVRTAYLEFKFSCEEHHINIDSELPFRDDVAAVTPRLQMLIENIGESKYVKIIHDTLQHPKLEDMDLRPRWTRQDWMMRFLLTIELWRRSDVIHQRRRLWTWESSETVAELLAAVLFQCWLMDREVCFDVVACAGSLHLDELWQGWLDKYALLTDEGEQDDEYEPRAQRKHDFLVPPLGLNSYADMAEEIGYYGGVGNYATWPLCMKQSPKREKDDGMPQH